MDGIWIIAKSHVMLWFKCFKCKSLHSDCFYTASCIPFMVAFGSVAFSGPLNFWSYLPDSIGPIQRYRRTSALSDVGRRTKWWGIWQFGKNTPKWFSMAPKSMRLARWVVGHWRMCRVARKSTSTTTGNGNFVATLWKSTSLTAWLIWFWISALATWSQGRRLWKMSLRLGFNWVTIQRSSYWFKQCIHESARQCCNT